MPTDKYGFALYEYLRQNLYVCDLMKQGYIMQLINILLTSQKKQTRERKMIAASIVARIKCALVLIIFMLIPLLPITGTIGLFILIFRPIWFKKLVDNVYADKNDR